MKNGCDKQKTSFKDKIANLISVLLEKIMPKNKKSHKEPMTTQQKQPLAKTPIPERIITQVDLPLPMPKQTVIEPTEPIREEQKLDINVELFVELPQEDPIFTEWVVGAASCIGLGHITKNLPCQDNHYIEHWDEQSWWGVAVCCDGAGSAKKSDQGSAKVAKEYIPQNIKKELDFFIKKNTMPTLEEWQKIAMHALLESVRCLQKYADGQQANLKEFACTAIVVVFTPFGLLQCNIGDGRACYRDEKGQWLPLMKPYKPDNGEANVTVFITSNIWDNPQKTLQYMAFNSVKNATAFALMSDGCENYMYICSPVDTETGEDPNQPKTSFFEPLYQYVIDNKLTETEIDKNIQQYLEDNSKLKKEQDDKTLLLAVNCARR